MTKLQEAIRDLDLQELSPEAELEADILEDEAHEQRQIDEIRLRHGQVI